VSIRDLLEVRVRCRCGAIRSESWRSSNGENHVTDGEPMGEADAQLEEWFKRIVRQDDWRSAPLSGAALEALLDGLPDQSLTQSDIERLDRKRRSAEDIDAELQDLPQDNLGQAFGELCRRRGVEFLSLAPVFGVSSALLAEVFDDRRSFFELPPSSLPRVAKTLRMELQRLVDLLKAITRQTLLSQVRCRAAVGISRSDRKQPAETARADALRLALGRISRQNEAAARFFAAANALVREHSTQRD
jgi:hypothetical protein